MCVHVTTCDPVTLTPFFCQKVARDRVGMLVGKEGHNLQDIKKRLNVRVDIVDLPDCDKSCVRVLGRRESAEVRSRSV